MQISAFLVIEHGQFRAVARRHLGRFDQCRRQKFVMLLRPWRALYGVARTLLRTAQPVVAHGFLDRLKASRRLSREKLAKLADSHRNYIGGIDRGERNVSLINIVKLAHGLQSYGRDLGCQGEPR